MHYSANVIIKLQHFSRDSAGNLHGSFGVYSSASSMTPIGNISVQSHVVPGVDPIASLNAALAARGDMPEMVEVADTAPTPASPYIGAPAP